MVSKVDKEFANGRGVFYANPIFRTPQPDVERYPAEWAELRKFFSAAFNGEFERLDGLLDFFRSARGYATRDGACKLIGDACTDRQLEAVEAFVLDAGFDSTRACYLCEPLAIWGRLSAAKTILTVYDRYTSSQDAEAIPAYLTTMLEPEWGPAADYPEKDTLEEFLAYEAGVNAVYAKVLAKIGDDRLPVAFGEVFGVRRLVERYLEHLGPEPYSKMMRAFFRRRFEASTGIDCSEFYNGGEFFPLVAAARLEAWIDSPEADRYEPGVRYFFGHRIPSST